MPALPLSEFFRVIATGFIATHIHKACHHDAASVRGVERYSFAANLHRSTVATREEALRRATGRVFHAA